MENKEIKIQAITIVNKYNRAIKLAIEKPVADIQGEYNEDEFEAMMRQEFSAGYMKYVNFILFDITAIKNNYLEAIRFVRTNMPERARLMIIAPNLTNRSVLQQIFAYGVLDVIKTEVNEDTSNDDEIDKNIATDIIWQIKNPSTYKSFVDEQLSIPSQELVNYQDEKNIANNSGGIKIRKFGIGNQNKPRLVGFYDEDNSIFGGIEKAGKYNIVSILKATDGNVANFNYNNVDIVVLKDVSLDLVKYIKSLIDVNPVKPILISGYKNKEDKLYADEIKGLITFNYEAGNTQSFARNVSINSYADPQKQSEGNGKIYAVFGTKGGCGATTLTAVMAQNYALEHEKEKVIVVDFSLKGGDLAEKFGIEEPKPNSFEYILQLVKNESQNLDINLIKDKIVNYTIFDKATNVFVMPTAFADIYKYCKEYDKATPATFGKLYSFIIDALKDNFDAIFLDVSRWGGIAYEVAMSRASKIILVSNTKVSGAMQLMMKLDDLTEEGYLDKISVVLNQSNHKIDDNEYDNVNLIKSSNKISKDKIAIVSFDKKLFEENKEMTVDFGKSFAKDIDDVWNVIETIPGTKKMKAFGIGEGGILKAKKAEKKDRKFEKKNKAKSASKEDGDEGKGSFLSKIFKK